MLMILARFVRSESFWAVVKVRSPHTGPGIRYIIRADPVQLPKTPSPRWYGLVFGSCARFGSLQPSFISITFADAPKARAMSATWA